MGANALIRLIGITDSIATGLFVQLICDATLPIDRSASAASSRCGAHVAHERRGDALRRDRHRSGCRSRSRILATTNCAKTGALWARALRTRSLSTACCTLMTRA
ncbi:hypothetical protein EXIGLDRAFT_47308 [Exidia glandulosa HHB12029]|uniref:Uncharacterized protein n=1 Tax=Exidia glandulosa HHB12029 TaxID=1314781 RepID=A0A165P5K3_EXIGL|nr:hypothetical protein EXIGLDRAFT_47308 [Exidia glandulosa HHB12029]